MKYRLRRSKMDINSNKQNKKDGINCLNLSKKTVIRTFKYIGRKLARKQAGKFNIMDGGQQYERTETSAVELKQCRVLLDDISPRRHTKTIDTTTNNRKPPSRILPRLPVDTKRENIASKTSRRNSIREKRPLNTVRKRPSKAKLISPSSKSRFTESNINHSLNSDIACRVVIKSIPFTEYNFAVDMSRNTDSEPHGNDKKVKDRKRNKYKKYYDLEITMNASRVNE